MRLMVLFGGLGVFALATAEPRSVSYDWLTLGEKSGELVVNYGSNGQQTATFEFNDRGRGPQLQEKIQLDQAGQMTRFEVTGHSYMGAPVDERFHRVGQQASWHSADEQGEAEVDQPAAYVNGQGSPETFAVMVRSVLQQPDHRMALLPSGTAVVKELTRTEVSHGEQNKQVKLMAVSGLGFTPSYIWLDEHNQLFAVAYGWMGLAPAGWGAVLPELQQLQDTADQQFHQGLAQSLTEDLPSTVLINNINLLDVKQGRLLEGASVYLKDGQIQQVSQGPLRVSAGKTIDGQGHTLMPGLWDMHTHIGLSEGLLQIAAGVTSVRDLANKHDDLLRTIAAFDQGEVIGPHVHKAGFIDQKSPYSAPTGHLAETLDEALAHIDWYAQQGYPQIKIYSSITPAWVKPMADRIHQHGMRLSGHIPSFMTAEQAVKDGYDEIQHINMLFLNFLAGPEDDTRTPVRFTLVGAQAGALDLDSKAVNDFIQLLKEQQVVVDPTVTIFHSMFLNRTGQIDPGYAMIADHLPVNVRRSFLGSTLEITAEQEPQYEASAEALLKLTKKLHDAGIQLVAGTDAIAGFTLHRELELYVQAGITPSDVLRMATLESAQVVGQEATSGSIDAGKMADLVLVEGNPLADISAIRKVIWTIKGNRQYDAAQLYQSIGIKPFTNASK